MKLRAAIILTGAFLFCSVIGGAQQLVKRQSLDTGWHFRQAGTQTRTPAQVPGTVHTDLMAAGRIQDPYYRLNERDVQWIDKVNWEYETTFTLDDSRLNFTHHYLVFEGLDTYASVMLNGQNILEADNMFVTWRVDVSRALKPGANNLRIYFTSPVLKGMEKQEAFGYPLPASNDQSVTGGMGPNQVSIFTRKAGYHFGWDWGPRLVTSGIWRPVYLESWSDARMDAVHVKQKPAGKNAVTITAEAGIECEIPGSYALTATIDGQEMKSVPVQLGKGYQKQSVDFVLNNPELWWPNGLGNQRLYTLSLKLTRGGDVIHRAEERIGIRTIRLIREPDRKGSGESFYFEVNGRPVFAKGANYIPNDVFLPRVSPETLEFIVKSAADANMNMLRVWGGGVYEDDLFYELCDRYGIMVWQDFMFACSMYPGDPGFLNSVRREAEENVKRLRNHACIALWCGNNEIEIAWAEGHENKGWGWKELYNTEQRRAIWQAYDTLFHNILPSVVEKFTGNQPYWHSSPSAGLYKLSNYQSNSGDMHYWGVWHGQEPFSDYRKYRARFMSEYGFQSFPEFNSVKNYTLPGDWDIESEVMAAHQRSGIGNLRIRQYMEQDYQVPEDFEHLLYVGQLLQADAIKMALKTHRSDMPYCMGSLYWQLNDCWPVASWSGIDYYKRWKALHYYAREACKNQIVNAVVEGDKILIYGVSDLAEKKSAILRMNLGDFSGNSLWNRAVKVNLPANGSSLVYSLDLNDLPLSYRENEVVFTVKLMSGTAVIDREFVYFAKPASLKLPDPGLKTRVSRRGDEIVIEVTSARLCKNLMLISDNDDALFSDNFFDMEPGETRLIRCPSDLSWEEFEKGFRTLHLQQTMH